MARLSAGGFLAIYTVFVVVDVVLKPMCKGVEPYRIARLAVILIIMFYPLRATWLPDLWIK